MKRLLALLLIVFFSQSYLGAADRYMCFAPTNSITLTGTWTFTNASDTITADSDGNAVAEVTIGDYIKQSDGTAWYEVESITNDDAIVFVTNFKQATHTDEDGASCLAEEDVCDGTAVADAFVSMNQYTKTEVRTAGDILYVRANETHATNGVDITFDEDGTVDDYIFIIGCDSVTNDPWSDGSDVLPIFDFEDAAYNINLDESYWWIERLDLKQSNDASGPLFMANSDYAYIKSCVFRESAGVSVSGLSIFYSDGVIIDDCSFADNEDQAIYISAVKSLIKNCTIDAGVGGTTYGVSVYTGSVDIVDTTIAGTNAFGSAAIKGDNHAIIRLRNVTFGTETYSLTDCSYLYSEDHDGTFESQLQKLNEGDIERDTGTVRGGGADSSAKMTSNANCGPNSPLRLGDLMTGFARIWATKDVEIDIDVYVAVGSAWDSALDAGECYAEFSYLSNAATAARTLITSDDTITNDTNFTTALDSGNFTPLQTGWVYIWICLAEYEDDTEHIFVDIKPVVN